MSTMTEEYEEQDDSISLLELALIFKKNIKLLTVGPLLAGVMAFGLSSLIKPTFTASTSFLPPQQQSAAASMLQGLGALGGLAGVSGIKNPADQYIAFLRSRSVQGALVRRFDLQKRYELELHDDALGALSNNVAISAGKDGLIRIDVDDHDAAFSAQLANAYVDELRKLLSRLAVTEAQQRRAFYEKQLEHAKGDLGEAQLALQRSGIKEGSMRAEPRMAAEAYAKLKAEVTSAEVKVQSMRSYLSDQSAEFKLAQANLAALRDQLIRTESVSVASVDDGYIGKYRDFKYKETVYDIFVKQFELAKLDEVREGSLIQVLDVAQAPQRKSKPKRALIAVGSGFAAGFFVLLFVFIREWWGSAKAKHPASHHLAN